MTPIERTLIIVAFVLLLSVAYFISEHVPSAIDESAVILRVPGTYESVQAAVDNAEPGERILVDARRGPFHGSIFIETPGIILMSEQGRALLIAEELSDEAIRVMADGVTVSGFEIQSSRMGIQIEQAARVLIFDNAVRNTQGMGIVLIDVLDSRIESNEVVGNFHGIWVSGNSDRNVIRNNTVEDNLGVGIAISQSVFTELAGNTVMGSGLMGIEVLGGSRNVLRENRISQNNGTGINLEESANQNMITDNIIEENKQGIDLFSSHENVIHGNLIRGNANSGINFNNSTGSQLELNELRENGIGVRVGHSDRGALTRNDIAGNDIGVEVLGGTATLKIWENNISGNSDFGLINRSDGEVRQQIIIGALQMAHQKPKQARQEIE